VDDGDSRITRQVDAPPTCGRRPRPLRRAATLPGVSSDGGTIEVPPEEVYALASGVRDQAGLAEEAAARLGSPPAVGGPLQPALEDFLLCHRTTAHALAGELRWLGLTIAAVVDSWLQLDGSVLAPRGRATPR
jgi:hypothetical protein